eukprot:8440053-Pyramimonas_sp.AAC.1
MKTQKSCRAERAQVRVFGRSYSHGARWCVKCTAKIRHWACDGHVGGGWKGVKLALQAYKSNEESEGRLVSTAAAEMQRQSGVCNQEEAFGAGDALHAITFTANSRAVRAIKERG